MENVKDINNMTIGELYVNSKISSTFVINGTDQVVTGIKEFEDGIDIGENNDSLGHKCLAVGNDLIVGSYNFFYKGIQFDEENLSARIYLTSKQPRFPYPFVTTTNGGPRKFKLQDNVVDMDDWENTKTYLSSAPNSSLSNNLSSMFYCINSFKWIRDDYNQLCIDLGPNYWENMENVRGKIEQYLEYAMTPDTDLSVFNLENRLSSGDIVTMVNNDKITSQRCATLSDVTENGSVLEVGFNQLMTNYLSTHGIMFPDFDFDDFAIIYSDKPTLSGPANTSTYSSLNVGTENTCLRRCSMVVGKENAAQADFSVALGRRAKANHYCSFVWSPSQKYVESPTDYTFTIGQIGRLSALIKPTSTGRTLYVANRYGESQELHKFIFGCVSSDVDLLYKIFNDSKEYLDNYSVFKYYDGSCQLSSLKQSATYKQLSSEEQLLEIILGKNVTTLDTSAFVNCPNLTGASLPEVTYIKSFVFKNLQNLQSLDTPNVLSIGSNSFQNCTNIKNVYLPNTVQIGSASFQRCSSLSSVYAPKATKIVGYSFLGCNALTSVGCKDTDSVRLGECELTIGQSSFSGCTGLKMVSIPKGTVSIGNQAFVGCTALSNATIPNSVLSIDQKAFDGCTSLTSLTFEGRTIDEVREIPDSSGTKRYPWGVNEKYINTKTSCDGYQVNIKCGDATTSVQTNDGMNGTVVVGGLSVERYGSAENGHLKINGLEMPQMDTLTLQNQGFVFVPQNETSCVVINGQSKSGEMISLSSDMYINLNRLSYSS